MKKDEKQPTTPTPKKRRRAKKPVLDTSWHENFLLYLSQSANVSLSARGTGIHRDTAYEHRRLLPEFEKRWDSAIQEAVDMLEAEAWKRARSTSDTLLIFLLKAHRPEKYREYLDLNHTGNIDVTILTDEELLRIADSKGPRRART